MQERTEPPAWWYITYIRWDITTGCSHCTNIKSNNSGQWGCILYRKSDMERSMPPTHEGTGGDNRGAAHSCSTKTHYNGHYHQHKFTQLRQ